MKINPSDLFRYKLNHVELLVLQVMCASAPGAQFTEMSLGEVAAYTKLGRRTVQSCINGTPATNKRPARLGLIQKGVLIPTAPHSSSERRPTTYRIHLEVLELDPRVTRFVSEQNLNKSDFSTQDYESLLLQQRDHETEN